VKTGVACSPWVQLNASGQVRCIFVVVALLVLVWAPRREARPGHHLPTSPPPPPPPSVSCSVFFLRFFWRSVTRGLQKRTEHRRKISAAAKKIATYSTAAEFLCWMCPPYDRVVGAARRLGTIGSSSFLFPSHPSPAPYRQLPPFRLPAGGGAGKGGPSAYTTTYDTGRGWLNPCSSCRCAVPP
jgi:hypothetical protein